MPIFQTIEQLNAHIELYELYEMKRLNFYYQANAITDENYLIELDLIITKWNQLSKDHQDNWLNESRLKAL